MGKVNSQNINFHVTDTLISESEHELFKELRKEKKSLYEDTDYIVTKTCSGEWGGTVKFKNKETGKEFSCAATCPVSINKMNDKYVVTSALAHLIGHSEVLEISDPKNLEIFKLPPPRKKRGKKEFRYVGDDESKSKKGTTVLLDSVGILIRGSFIFKEELYQIILDNEKLFVGKIDRGRIRIIKLISSNRLFTYDDEILSTKNSHLIVPIGGGYLDIFENKIRVLRFH
jgi:hypothetical protein